MCETRVPGSVSAGTAPRRRAPLLACANGEDAIQAIEESPPDVLFLDIQMPELDGFDVLQAVGVGRVPVVIFVTAYDQFALRAFEAHALDYLLNGTDRPGDVMMNRRLPVVRSAHSAAFAGVARIEDDSASRDVLRTMTARGGTTLGTAPASSCLRPRCAPRAA